MNSGNAVPVPSGCRREFITINGELTTMTRGDCPCGIMHPRYKGQWAVLNRQTKQYLESHTTKDKALAKVAELNKKLNIYAVVPLTQEKLNKLRG